MAYIKPSKPFNQELEKVLAYALFEFGVTTVKRFNQAYQSIRNRLAIHPYSSPKEPLLKSFLRSYRSSVWISCNCLNKNWKIIYRYDKEYDRIILVDLWDMRRNPKYLIRQFRRKL